MATPIDGLTLMELCTAHFSRTDRDHILHQGAHFKQLNINGAQHAALLYALSASPRLTRCVALLLASRCRARLLPPSSPPPSPPARHYYAHVSACFVYPALTSPLFAGMHLYVFFLMYLEEVEAVLSLGPVRCARGVATFRS